MLRRDAAPTYIAGSIWVSVTAANRWFYGRLPIVIMLLPLFLLISNTGEANLRALQRFYLQRTLSTKKRDCLHKYFFNFSGNEKELVKRAKRARKRELLERYVWLLSVTLRTKRRSGKEINYYMGRAGTGDMAISENLSPFVSRKTR